jgi:hypothetical protein
MKRFWMFDKRIDFSKISLVTGLGKWGNGGMGKGEREGRTRRTRRLYFELWISVEL